jgi:hypothetical protein
MNSWWNLHVFSLRPRQRERRQPVPVTSRASQRSGCSLSAGSAHKWPGPGRPTARPGEGWKNQLGGSGWVIHWGLWYDMYLHMIYIYIYKYDIYIYIQIWNGSYLYMSSCHVDNAMVITTTVNHVNNQAAWTASGRFTWLNHVQPTFLMIDAFKEY